MSRKFTVIPSNTFDNLQLDAGVILKNFNPVTGGAPADSDILTATTGGITATCTPTFSDLGEDVDNCPANMKELKNLDSWECTLAFTALNTDAATIKMALGAADINDTTQIVPRKDLAGTDFADLWWVGDKADGGYVAVQLKNALSTGGFSLTTTKSGKGNLAVTLTGHVSINDQTTMPMVFYTTDSGTVNPSVTLNKHSVTVTAGETVTLRATAVPNSASVSWSSGNDEVATVTSGGVVAGVAEGDTIITAEIAVDGVEYTDTCTVIVEAADLGA